MARLASCLRTTEITQFRRGRTMFLFLGCPRSLSISTPFRGLEKFPAIPGNRYYLSYNSRTTINYSANPRAGVISHILRGQVFKTKVFRELSKQLLVVPVYHRSKSNVSLTRGLLVQLSLSEDINIGLYYPRTLYSSSMARELSIIPLASRGPPFMSSWTRELT